MRLVSKAKGLVNTLAAMSHFVTDRREMVHSYQKQFWKYAFQDLDFREVIGQATETDLHLNLGPDKYGDVSWQELVAISALVANYRPNRIFEFGTFMGKTTYHLAANSPAAAEVFTLDLPPETFEQIIHSNNYDFNLLQNGKRAEVGYYYKRSTHVAKVKQLFADSRAFDETPYLESMDLIFVDADHAYESVLNDTRKALRMLKREPGKVILWHDLRQRNEVERVITELCDRERIRHISDTMLGMYVS